MNTYRVWIAASFLVGALLLPGLAYCVEFNGSGFLTLAAGKMLDSETSDAYLVSDYGQGGIYENNKGWSLGPDSKLGLQGILTFSPEWSATGQVVSRGARQGKVDLEWLYLTYKATENLTLQAGRKRLPLFYYSESQDVGIALPWIRLPTPAYGWDVVNFNGVNLAYRSQLGSWNSFAEVFYGNETRHDSPYLEIYNGRGTNWDEEWNNIRGIAWTLSRDWLDLRFSYVGSGMEYWNTQDKANTRVSTNQSFYSIAAAVDRDNWLVRTEVSKVKRPGSDFQEHDWSAMMGVGYRYGKWLPMVTFARYHGKYEGDRPQERFDNTSLSLRYDLTASSALKLQLDTFNDRSDHGITCYQDPSNCAIGSQRYGDSKLISVSYDMIF